MNRDACSGRSLGILRFVQVPPGNVEVPGDGSRQNEMVPELPVYCSKRI